MKIGIKILAVLFVGTIVLLLYSKISFSAESKFEFSSGSPGGRTNSPGDGQVCTMCHSGAVLNSGNATTSISSEGLNFGYLPGQTYTMNVSVIGASTNRIGFEVTAENLMDSSKVGTIIITDEVRTRLANYNNSITHEYDGTFTSNNESTWEFDWIAPVESVDTIVFYGAFNVANGNGITTGDKIYTTTFAIVPNTTDVNEMDTEIKVDVFPNPCANNIIVQSELEIKKMELLTSSGQRLQEISSNKMEMEKYENGIYFLKIHFQKGSVLKKIIKND